MPARPPPTAYRLPPTAHRPTGHRLLHSFREEDRRHHPRHHRRTRRWCASTGITQGVVAGDGARQDRDVQSRQLDQGPHGGEDDRGRRARRAAEAGRHDHRRHLGQHRHGPGDRRRRQGLQVHLHDHRQAVEGEGRRAQGVRRRGDRLPDQRRSGGSAVVLLGVVAARARGARTRGRPTSTTTCRTRRRTTSRPGPEIWEQTDGRVTHLVVGVGTGGTISRRRPVPEGAQPRGSRSGASTPTDRCSRSTRRPASSTRTRSTRTSPRASARTSCRRTWTSRVIDHFEKVTDKDAAIMTRRIAREEGIFAGNSAGSAMAGLLQLQGSLHDGRCGRRDLPRPRVALSRQDVQRRLDAREGVPREERHDRARSRRGGRLGRAAARSRRTSRSSTRVR